MDLNSNLQDEIESLSEPSEMEDSGSDWQPSEEETFNYETEDDLVVEDPGLPNGDLVENEREHPEPKKTRKRHQHENIKEKRKRLRNSGIEYTTKRGKVIFGKKFVNENCLCTHACFGKISEEDRKHAFESFWKLGSFTAQNSFICGLIKQKLPSTRRPKNAARNPKLVSNSFYIHSAGESVKVCKKYFLQTFLISDGRMSRAIKKLKVGEQIGSDNRGCAVPPNKISDERMQSVRKHIEQFPCFESHYSRAKNPNRRYLSSDLNVTLMYELYTEYCKEISIVPVSIDVYRRTFNNEYYNLHFHAPRSDTCSKCDEYKIKKSILTNETEIKALEAQHEFHLRKAELARTSMANDAEMSKTNPLIYAFTFDLEKALPFPKLKTSIAYYKRNMYVYNFGCNELKTKLGFMYAWDETTASRGSQEIISCVQKHIESRASEAEHVISYSDSCTGQNRNWNVALFMLKLVLSDSNNIKTYDHKFMVSGHSYLPNDTDFASIESHSKGKHIYVPQDWYRVIMQCRKKKAFHLTRMERNDFVSSKKLTDAIMKRKKNVEGQPISWLKIQWIRCVSNEPHTLFYKESLNEDVPFHAINIQPNTRKGRPKMLQNIIQDSLYNGPRPVTAAKRNDMHDLLPFIPPIHHEYFNNLTLTNVVDDSGPLTDHEEETDESVV